MFKVAWLIPILAFPIGGSLFYLLFGRSHLNKKNAQKLQKTIDSSDGTIIKNLRLIEEIKRENGHVSREVEYLTTVARSDVYQNTETKFLSPGSVFFEELVLELEKAEEFVFLEYFIVGEGSMWSRIHGILLEKLRLGVDVRLIYDDFGSISTVPPNFAEKLRAEGFKVAAFNMFKPSLDKFMNYRDHRKLTIIDNKVAFTGGINIADEYINQKERFGFWSDSSVKVKGDAVVKNTVLFLEMWYFTTGELPDYQKYLKKYSASSDGYVIPFADEPLLSESISENAYVNVINNARSYIYICTPYLILDNVIASALINAAKSGVKVVIITPHTPDKKLVFMLTRANYKELVCAGVEIYEFTPGFMHTKMIISDGSTAIVGTSNFDYRSFYMHFENGIWMHGSAAVQEAKESFEKIKSISERITKEFCENVSMGTRLGRSLLNLFSPLL